MDYYKLLSFGDVIELDMGVNCEKLLDEIYDFEWSQYNPRKQNNRFGLSITSSDGELNNIDLDSLYEYNIENNTSYTETSFKTRTPVYYSSKEIQKVIDPFDKHVCRAHLINLKINGSFPPHRDWRRIDAQENFRILVPLKCCNPNEMYFMYENNPLYFNHGRAYFINTNKNHSVFSFSEDATFIVINVEANTESINVVLNHMKAK
jgi:hypothetical protein